MSLELSAPAPLSPLTDVVISPQNIAIEQRERHARVLSLREQGRIRQQLKQLNKQLAKANAKDLHQMYQAAKPRMKDIYELLIQLRLAVKDSPDDEISRQFVLDYLTAYRTDVANWRALRSQIRQTVLPAWQERRRLARLLDDHKLAVAREKTLEKQRKELESEAEIYRQIIVDKWTSLGYCHRYTEKDKEHVHRVAFSNIGITLDAHYYKIDASYKTIQGAWKTNIPQGVKVVEQLLNPSTLDELSVACQRQVTGVTNQDGAWVVVHRLNSVDGLLNFVRFDDVMERYPAQYAHKMPICIGVGVNREIQWINLDDYAHWLIGGFTGSGKSNIVNVGVCTLITRQHPRDLRLVLIDLKGGLEFNYYRDIPHLHGEIVDSVENVANVLSEMEALMKERFGKFRGIAKRISEYHIRRPGDPMPRVLVVFDEVASIMGHGELTKRITASLRELTRMGRAVGIHIWLCTQRPDTAVIDGSIKANMAVRISGRMPTSADSITILGSGAAKELASIPGRMVLQLGPDPYPIQSPYIDIDDIELALKRAKQFSPPPVLEIPEGAQIVHQVWDVERVVELSIKHLGGRITWKDVYQAADDLSQSQARKLVEQVWNVGAVKYDGQEYRVQRGKGHMRTLVPVEMA